MDIKGNSLRLIIVVLVLQMPLITKAQVQRGISNDQSINNLIVELWTTEQGLITNKIIKVKQSSDGYLWMATYDGILRFDGISFDLYNSANTAVMKQDTYYGILESEDSTLWFFSRGDGILTYKTGVFNRFEMEGLPKSMRSMFIDSKQRLWIAGFEEILYVEDGKIIRLNHPSMIDGSVLKIAEDDKGTIYFGTDGKGVIAFDGNSYKSYTKTDGLYDNSINSLQKTQNGDIVVGTFFGISIISNDTVRGIPSTKGARINDIFVDEYSNILLGTDIGLYRINESANIYEKLSEGNKLPTREINSIEIDHEGSIWLALERGGLAQFKSGKIDRYTTDDGLSLDRVNVISQRNENEYWVGTDNGQVDVIDLKNGTISKLRLDNLGGNNGIRDILFDGETTWIASYSGLLKIENGKEINYTDKTGLSSKLVRQLMKDSIGNIWVATRSGGINKISPNGTIEVFDKSRGLKSDYILSLHESKGLIYAGANRGGISIISPDGSVVTFENENDDLADAVYFNIQSDTKGRIWIAGSNGLFHFKNNIFVQLKLKPGLSTNSFFDVLDDNAGSLWLTTSKGVVQLSMDEVDSCLSKKLDAVNYTLYNDMDGLPSSECTAATKSLLDANGKLWIPTNAGIAVVDPLAIEKNPTVAPTYIKYFRVDDDEYDIYHSSISVKPGHVRYTVGFSALSYVAAKNIKIKYRLKGVDKDWNYVSGAHREIQYTNIDPGMHTFEVFATNNDGLWNPKSAKLVFEVEPFIYQTTWFYVVLFLFFITIFLLSARWRIARVQRRNIELQKLNAELDSFVYSTSHDLRAPLASMLGLLNIAKLDDDLHQKNAYMEMMESSIKKLDGFIQDIIDYSRNTRLEVMTEPFDIRKLVEGIMEELRYMDREKLIEKKLVFHGDVEIVGDVQRMKIILNNIISNAIKYYDINKKKCMVSISIKNQNNELSIVVEDNGIGIEEDQIKHVFEMFYRATESSKGSGIGLYIVKETVNKLRGTVYVSSIPTEGTIFNVKIPIAH